MPPWALPALKSSTGWGGPTRDPLGQLAGVYLNFCPVTSLCVPRFHPDAVLSLPMLGGMCGKKLSTLSFPRVGGRGAGRGLSRLQAPLTCLAQWGTAGCHSWAVVWSRVVTLGDSGDSDVLLSQAPSCCAWLGFLGSQIPPHLPVPAVSPRALLQAPAVPVPPWKRSCSRALIAHTSWVPLSLAGNITPGEGPALLGRGKCRDRDRQSCCV